MAAAALRGAAAALARGVEAGAWLERVPAGTRWSGPVAWLRAVASGEPQAAVGAEASRVDLAARLVAAADALEGGDYAGAARFYAAADQAYATERRRLDSLATPEAVATVWADWDTTAAGGTGLVFDPLLPIAAGLPLVRTALDLDHDLPRGGPPTRLRAALVPAGSGNASSGLRIN